MWQSINSFGGETGDLRCETRDFKININENLTFKNI